MKYLLCAVVVLASFSGAHAITCPDPLPDYMPEIRAIRAQQDALTVKIDNSPDYQTALKYVRESDSLDHRISEIVKTVNECDGIGRLAPRN